MAGGVDEPPDEAELAARAEAHCLAHAAREIPGDLTVEPRPPTTDLDPAHMRDVFEQMFAIWRRAGDFEVFVDDGGQPIGFRDLAEEAACRWAAIDETTVLKAASDSGWVSAVLVPDGPLIRTAGEGASLVVVDGSQPAPRNRYQVVVNPTARKLVAVMPAWPAEDLGS